MDRETRGLISEKIDYAFEKQPLLKTISWILEADDRVVSQEDFALGYFIGSLMNIAYDIAFHKKLGEKSDKKFKKGLGKIYGKGKSYERLRERDRIIEDARAKGGRRIKAELTEEETEDIRNMLIPMITPLREKIRKEVALRRL